MNNPYAVLGLSPDCTDKQLKKAMRQLSKRWHPDMNPGQEEFAQKKFREVQEAYEEIIIDRRARQRTSYADAGEKENQSSTVGNAYQRSGAAGRRYGSGNAGRNSNKNRSSYDQKLKTAASYLKAGRNEDAYVLLGDVSWYRKKRTTVWYYYMIFHYIYLKLIINF